jgi:hypothetical protein
MALKLSAKEIETIRSQGQRFAARAKNLAEKAEEAVNTFVQTTEISAAAFGFGMIQGRWEGVEVLGVPIDLGVGVGLHLLGFLGVGGKAAPHMHNFGDGALACYLTTVGKGVGTSMRLSAGGAASSGALPGGGAAPLSDAEIARLARQGAAGA